jgi:hypothetical protein
MAMDTKNKNPYLAEMKKLLDEAVREGFLSKEDAEERYADAQENDRLYHMSLGKRKETQGRDNKEMKNIL